METQCVHTHTYIHTQTHIRTNMQRCMHAHAHTHKHLNVCYIKRYYSHFMMFEVHFRTLSSTDGHLIQKFRVITCKAKSITIKCPIGMSYVPMNIVLTVTKIWALDLMV